MKNYKIVWCGSQVQRLFKKWLFLVLVLLTMHRTYVRTGTNHENSIANIFAIHSHGDCFCVLPRILNWQSKIRDVISRQKCVFKRSLPTLTLRLQTLFLLFFCVHSVFFLNIKVLDVIVIDRKMSWDTGTTLSNLLSSLVYFHLQPEKHSLPLLAIRWNVDFKAWCSPDDSPSLGPLSSCASS